MLYLIPIVILVIALIPMFIGKDPEKPRGVKIIGWIVIGLVFFVAADFFLVDFAHQTERNRVANCPPELVYHDSTFGNKCTSPITNPFEKQIVDNFGGPFDGLMTMLIGLPAILVLSIIGFVMEIVSRKKRSQGISKALWSTSFLVLISSLVLVLSRFVI